MSSDTERQTERERERERERKRERETDRQTDRQTDRGVREREGSEEGREGGREEGARRGEREGGKESGDIYYYGLRFMKRITNTFSSQSNFSYELTSTSCFLDRANSSAMNVLPLPRGPRRHMLSPTLASLYH